jgi:hypothetical protein
MATLAIADQIRSLISVSRGVSRGVRGPDNVNMRQRKGEKKNMRRTEGVKGVKRLIYSFRRNHHDTLI